MAPHPRGPQAAGKGSSSVLRLQWCNAGMRDRVDECVPHLCRQRRTKRRTRRRRRRRAELPSVSSVDVADVGCFCMRRLVVPLTVFGHDTELFLHVCGGKQTGKSSLIRHLLDVRVRFLASGRALIAKERTVLSSAGVLFYRTGGRRRVHGGQRYGRLPLSQVRGIQVGGAVLPEGRRCTELLGVLGRRGCPRRRHKALQQHDVRPRPQSGESATQRSFAVIAVCLRGAALLPILAVATCEFVSRRPCR